VSNVLFDEYQLGSISLKNRIVMAPMTRARSTQPGDVPNELMAEYYGQRASAGLIISEATYISPQGKGYSFTPGIYSDEQVAGWSKVTKSVHNAGGRIFLQLWHVGRMSHSSFHADGCPVAPSAIAPNATVYVGDETTGEGGLAECPIPRALETDEIPQIVEEYRRAASRAMEAGFDGVEIHGANGYLIDQFLRESANRRSDQYGGNAENRVRFLKEVADAVSTEIGAERTGVRLSPFITERGMDDPNAVDTTILAIRALDSIGIAYIHLVEADWEDEPTIPGRFRRTLRETFSGCVIVAGRYDLCRANSILEFGLAELVAFGRPFIANPDLPLRLSKGLELAEYDPAALYGGGRYGYADYPPIAAGASTSK
jgi:N-ethylmaleimide reductase